LGALAVSLVAAFHAGRVLHARGRAGAAFNAVLIIGVVALAAHAAIEFLAQWGTDLRPQDNAYAALVYMIVALQAFFALVIVIMGLYTVARSLAGVLHAQRRVTFDNTRLLWYYTLAQALLALAVVHLSPRLLG
ncbi:MAG: cytochrome ubiquinol oxidase subunit I, partial [Burkholderiales bacterium]|nr:cytochrome ubiquinol oxidase subunit I [Burkholderiales bacterium]